MPIDLAPSAPSAAPDDRGASAVRRAVRALQGAIAGRAALRWLLALALFGLALGARFALLDVLPAASFPFLTFFPAVILGAWLAGLWPGLLVAALSVLSAWYWFVGPPGTFGGLSGTDAFALAFFGAILVVDCLVLDVMNRSISRLRQAERRLREVDARKDEFLAMLAHELRNPLTPLTNAIWLLKRRETLTPQGESALRMLERQAMQMQRLVDELLDIGRITHGKITILPEPVRLRQLVEQVAEALRPGLELRGQRLELVLPPQPVELRADAARLTQVLENLVLNASKFSPDGTAIRLELTEDPQGARIDVVDRGIGLAASDLERVFEAFVQAGPDPRDGGAQGGLGIGLAMVRRLVALHGGRVWAESAGRGRGARFVVVLPRHGRDPSGA